MGWVAGIRNAGNEPGEAGDWSHRAQQPPTEQASVTVNGEKTLTSSTEVRSVFKKGTPNTGERVGRCWVDQGMETGQDFLSQ